MKNNVKVKDDTQSLQSCVSGGFPIQDNYTKEQVKEIARAFTRMATPSKFIGGIDERFEKVWILNFGS